MENSTAPLCECGCGQKVNWSKRNKCWNRIIWGHVRKILSIEAEERIRQSNIGRNHSEETKRKLSELNIGRKHSEETKLKISIALTGKKHSEETKQKLSKMFKGRIITDESKEKMSKAHTGKILSTQHKENIGKAGRGRIHSEETKLKISLSTIITKNKESRINGYCRIWNDKEYVADLRGPSFEHCGMTNMQSIHIFGKLLCTHHKNGKKKCAPSDIMTLCLSCHGRLHGKSRNSNFRKS